MLRSMLECSRVLIVFHFNRIMICFYLELIFVYSYSWHSFHYDLGHSYGPLYGLLCFSIPTRSDSALIAPISPFILGVNGKLLIPTPMGGPVPTGSSITLLPPSSEHQSQVVNFQVTSTRFSLGSGLQATSTTMSTYSNMSHCQGSCLEYVVEQVSHKTLSLFSIQQQLCKEIYIIIMHVHVQCSPFISGSALPDKLVSDTL